MPPPAPGLVAGSRRADADEAQRSHQPRAVERYCGHLPTGPSPGTEHANPGNSEWMVPPRRSKGKRPPSGSPPPGADAGRSPGGRREIWSDGGAAEPSRRWMRSRSSARSIGLSSELEWKVFVSAAPLLMPKTLREFVGVSNGFFRQMAGASPPTFARASSPISARSVQRSRHDSCNGTGRPA